MSSPRKLRISNAKSNVLSEEENEIVFDIIGNRCITLATAVVQVFLAEPNNRQRWSRQCCGVACFIKDYSIRSYLIRVYDIKKRAIIWEQELYHEFKYKVPRQYFHTFEAQDAQAGLNFCNVDDANTFKKVIEDKLNEKKAYKAASNHTLRLGEQDREIVAVKKDKKRVATKGKEHVHTKEDSGQPTDYINISHYGYDPHKGLDTKDLYDDMTTLFEAVGIGETVDEETVYFIYDYVEKHGGMEAVKKEIASRPPLPPLLPGHAANKRGKALPSPPTEMPSRPLPPTPVSRPVTPPSPPQSRGRPSILPPPSNSRPGGFPPPPPMSSSKPLPQQPPKSDIPPPPPPPPPPPSVINTNPLPPPMLVGRGNVLNEIHRGSALKHVSDEKSSTMSGDSRNNLLDELRKGCHLKNVKKYAQAGLNFCNVDDANTFKKVIEDKLNENKAYKAAPNHTLRLGEQDGEIVAVKKDKKRVATNGKEHVHTKEDSGQPTDYINISHYGYDPHKGLDTMDLYDDATSLFQAVGIGETVDKETADFIYDYVKKHGGMEAVKKEIASRPPPPPLPPRHAANKHENALPSPPTAMPSRPLPPTPVSPPQSRGRSSILPPPSNSRPGGFPAPPPMSSSKPLPQQPPKSDIPPPPPPPPPPPSVINTNPPPPPMLVGRGNVLNEIHRGTALKHVSDEKSSTMSGDSRNNLLDEIRKGCHLKNVQKQVPQSGRPPLNTQGGCGGIIGELAKALANRQKQIQGSDDDKSDDDDDEEDDDWDD